MKQRLFLILGALLLAFVFANAFVNAAPPAQDPAPKTTTPEPLSIGEEQESAEAAELAPVAPGQMTSTILIFNPDSSGEATVQLDIYDASGAVAYTTTVQVAKNGMKMVALPGSLGNGFKGGAQISSDKNVQAIVIGANSSKTARDEYEGNLAPSLEVSLPLVRHLAANTQNTVLAIQNTTANDATVNLTLYNADGSTAQSEELEIAAHQSAYRSTNTFFPSGTFVGSARITSDQNIAVTAQTMYFKDTAAFYGANVGDSDMTLFLNQAERKINGVNVAVNWSEIFVRNNGENPTNITLDFYALTGELVSSFSANDVAPNGSAQFLLNDAGYAALGNAFSGWVKISSSSEPIAATALNVLNKGNRLYSINASAAPNIGKRYVCGDVSRQPTQNSQLKILNTDSSVNAKVIVRLFDKETGAKVAQAKFKIPANHSATVLMSDTKFAAAGTNYQGMALVYAKGATPPKIQVNVNAPFGDPKLKGTTGYACSKMQ